MDPYSACAMLAMMVLQAIKDKGKGKGDDDPTVGKRYWSDNIIAYGTYGPATAQLWCNQIFVNSEVIFHTDYLPDTYDAYQENTGEIEYNTGPDDYVEDHEDGGSEEVSWTPGASGVVNDSDGNFAAGIFDIGKTNTNTGCVPGFTIPYPEGGVDPNFFDTYSVTNTCNTLVKFSRGDGTSPEVASTYPGVSLLYVNQGYMGLNTAYVGNYRAIWSTMPGSAYILRSQGESYASESIWCRYRRTADCGLTLSLNPMVILTDILMDRYDPEEIDWLNAAEIGKRLINDKPYMWFSMAYAPQKYVDVVQDIAKKASIAIYRAPSGKVAFRLIGQDPPGGIDMIPVIDVVDQGFEVTINKPSAENAKIVNEGKATYLAARYCEETFEPYKITEVGQAELSEVANAELAVSDAKLKVSTATTEAEEAQAKAELAAAETQYTKLNSQYFTTKDDYMAEESIKDGHFLKAGVHSVNTAAMVLTGIRSIDTYNLDFLNWPDDARAYMEDSMLLYEHPLAEGNLQTSFAFNYIGVGDIFKLVLEEEVGGFDYQCIVEVGSKRILGFGDEKVEFSYKESGRYFGMAVGDPNTASKPDIIDGVPQNPPHYSKLPVWTMGALLSPMTRGFPIIAFNSNENSPALDGVTYYLTTDCMGGVKQADSQVAQESGYFPSVGSIVSIGANLAQENRDVHGPSYLHHHFITAEFPGEFKAPPETLAAILESKTGAYGGISDVFHTEDVMGENYFLLIKGNANTGYSCGPGYLFRAMNMQVSHDDTAAYVSIEGIYAADFAVPDLTFEEGDQVVILPRTNQMFSYGYNAVPIPASFGHTSVAGSQTFAVKSVPVYNGDERDWDACICNTMPLSMYWHQTPEFEVFGVNRTVPDFSDPKSVVYADLEDLIDIWIAPPDLRQMVTDRDMLSISRVVHGGGPEVDIAFMDTSTYKSSKESEGGVAYATVIIEFYHKGTDTLLYSEELTANKWHTTMKPSEVFPAFMNGAAIEVRVTVSYELPANGSLDQTTTLLPRTIVGPEIRCA